MKWPLLLLACLLFSGTRAQTIDPTITAIVDSFRTASNVPAIAAAVIRLDAIQLGLSGLRKAGEEELVDEQTLFHLASNTKAITAWVATRQVEKGVISWESAIDEVVPELADGLHAAYVGATFEDLLSHRALVPAFEDDGSPEWKGLPASIRTADDQRLAFASYALRLAPASANEDGFHYSNGGYIVAALMLERATGRSWEELLHESLSEAGMAAVSGFPSQQETNVSYGHQRKGRRYRPLAPEEEYPLDPYFTPAGNLSMSIADFSRFVQLHLQGLAGQDNVLPTEAYQYLHYHHPAYGLGWYNGYIGDTEQRFSYHGGSLGSYSSAVIISADRDVAIVVLVNADDKRVTELKNALRVRLWEAYGRR